MQDQELRTRQFWCSRSTVQWATLKNNDQILEAERTRESECPQRTNRTCKLVNGRIGWFDGMPMATCDQCWASGPDSDASANVREKYALKIIKTVIQNIESFDYPFNVISPVFSRHMTKAEAEASLLRICEKIGEEMSIKYAEIIDGRE